MHNIAYRPYTNTYIGRVVGSDQGHVYATA
jgi:hypothetical protein